MKSPTTIKQPGIHLLVFSHNLRYCTTKILLFSRLVYHPADNYQSKSDDNPECPSAQLQLHLLPAGEFLLNRIRHIHFLGYRHFLRWQIYRIWLRSHLRKQVAEAVNSQLGLCVLAVGYVKPRQNYSTISSHSSNALMVELSGGSCTSTSFSTTTLSALLSTGTYFTLRHDQRAEIKRKQ